MRTDLPANLQAPAAARRFVSAALDKLPRGRGRPPSDDVRLVVSELVTNSVHAGATTVEVALVASDDRVELHVSDDAAGWPAPRQVTPDDQQGRGLAIVEHIADDWQATPLAPGKRVSVIWSRFGAPATG